MSVINQVLPMHDLSKEHKEQYGHGLNEVEQRMEEVEEELNREKYEAHKNEKWPKILLQILFPFLIAGLGMVGAGIILNIVQEWELFKKINPVISLVPALLGLKGNLEMTLASRLSTQVNMGSVKESHMIRKAVLGNTFLVQIQSIVVGLLASFVACIVDLIKDGTVQVDNLLTLVVTSMSTASLASLLLGFIMIGLILLSHRYHINPDNIATPIAAALGDVVTLGILAYVGTLFYNIRETFWVHIVIIALLIIALPFLGYYCKNNDLVRETLIHGWIPVLTAMIISSTGGIILSYAIVDYKALAAYQPVVNGLGGNLVAVFASRLSTVIHITTEKGQVPTWAPHRFLKYPYETFFGHHNPEVKAARVLILLSIPGHLLFFVIIYFVESHEVLPFTGWLLLFYIICAFIQVLVLFLLCYWLVIFIWRIKRNPDNDSIPLLTSLGDLFGIGLLYICFILLDQLDYASYPVTFATTSDLTSSLIGNSTWSLFDNSTWSLFDNSTSSLIDNSTSSLLTSTLSIVN